MFPGIKVMYTYVKKRARSRLKLTIVQQSSSTVLLCFIFTWYQPPSISFICSWHVTKTQLVSACLT